MDFKGKICPYCKTEFKEGDDIVVCSVCEMPHHKDCWIENKACTTFGCTGTIAGADQDPKIEEEKSFCSNCGAVMEPSQKFCASCGTPASASSEPHFQAANAQTSVNQYQQSVYNQQQQYQNQNHTGFNQNKTSIQMDQDLYTFLQSNQIVYAEKFQKMEISNSKVSWNWCSFLCGSFWFAYRKMYGLATIYIMISLIIGLIPQIGSFLSFALCVCSGIFGNYFYKKYTDNELRFAKSMDTFSKAAYIAKKGGTSIAAIFGIIGIITAVVFIIAIVTTY